MTTFFEIAVYTTPIEYIFGKISNYLLKIKQ